MARTLIVILPVSILRPDLVGRILSIPAPTNRSIFQHAYGT